MEWKTHQIDGGLLRPTEVDLSKRNQKSRSKRVNLIGKKLVWKGVPHEKLQTEWHTLLQSENGKGLTRHVVGRARWNHQRH